MSALRSVEGQALPADPALESVCRSDENRGIVFWTIGGAIVCRILGPMTMQITLNLDDDLAFALQEEMKRSGCPIKDTIGAVLRRELLPPPQDRSAQPFRVHAHHMGNPPADLDLDNIGELLERIEGPAHR